MSKSKGQDGLTYRQKMAIIKPYVDFNYKQIRHSSEKAKINRYFRAMNEAFGQQVKAVKPKKTRLKKLKKATGLKLKGFTHVFIPVETANTKVKIAYDKKGNPTIKAGEIARKFYPFKFPDLITDTDAEVIRVLNQAKKDKCQSVSLAMGYFEFMQIFTLENQETENVEEYDEEYAAEYEAEYGEKLADHSIDGQILTLIRNMLNTYATSDKFLRGLYGMKYAKNSQLQKYVDAKNKYRAKTANKKRQTLKMGKNHGKGKAKSRNIR